MAKHEKRGRPAERVLGLRRVTDVGLKILAFQVEGFTTG
jgi:hypothetical protein